MSLLAAYRTLLAFQMAVVVLSLFGPAFLDPTVPEEVRTYLDASGEPSAAMLSAMFLLLLGYVVGCIGALWFWRPSRCVFAVAMAGMVLLNPLLGPSLDTGWKDLIEEAATVFDGVLLALMFFSPLSGRFTASTA